MKENIFLIGFMGAGKSTVAKVLSERLGCGLVEMDQRIVEEQGMSINEIFAQKGEEYFRDLESGLIQTLGQEEPSVVSCGGGAVLRPENVSCMRESGRIIYLSARPETIYERVKDSKSRPILNGHMNVDYIAELMEKRRRRYEDAADQTVETDQKSLEEICREIAGA